MTNATTSTRIVTRTMRVMSRRFILGPISAAWCKSRDDVGSTDADGHLPVEPSDVPSLPRRLHGSVVVVLSNVGDGSGRGHAVEHGQAGQRGAGPTTTTTTCDLDAVVGGAVPGFDQSITCGSAIRWKAEVRPPQPAVRPRRRIGLVAEQVEPEVGRRPAWDRRSQGSTSHDATARQHEDTLALRVPVMRHERTRYCRTDERPHPHQRRRFSRRHDDVRLRSSTGWRSGRALVPN